MLRPVLMAIATLGAASALLPSQATLHVQPFHLDGPRPLADQTAKTVIQDYVESWQTLHTALGENRTDVIDRDFVGTAKSNLMETIQDQAKAGVRTNYQDRSHDVQVVFYSPEGLSIELTDNVEYDQQVLDHDKVVTSQHVSAKYVVIMTPSETRWRVRIFQAVTN